jgi:hypothetical protein
MLQKGVFIDLFVPVNKYGALTIRRGGRAVEGARLESEYTLKKGYPGFESLLLRKFLGNKFLLFENFIIFVNY